MQDGDVHVDHLLPRQVVLHDEIWNLVLAHGFCNENKTDRLVGEHFIEKLIQRNENIMGSNHPWKKKIEQAFGEYKAAAQARRNRSLPKRLPDPWLELLARLANLLS